MLQELSDELHELLGTDAFARLCLVFGGSRQPIHDTPRCRQRLAVVLGEDAAGRLIERFRGDALDIPRGQLGMLRERNAAMRKDRDAGMSRAQLGAKYNLSIRQVANVLAASVSPA